MAGAAVVVLVAMAGVASASGTVVLGWSPPGTSDYGTLSPGATSPPQAFKLTNTGGSATSALKITVTPAAGTPASAFTKTADTCTGTSLGPKKSCSVSVTFTAPATPGSYQATLAAASNKPAAAASVTLTGMSGKATPSITTAQQPATGTVGVTIGDQATVTGPAGDSPTGTVTFYLYDNPNCNNPLLTQPEPLTSGVATIGGVLATGPGTAYWVASYGGDANNNSVTTGCADEPVTITPAQPAITTSQQPATAVVGAAIADQATVTGGFEPSGTVTFTLYDNPNCAGTPLFTDSNEQLPFDGTSVTSKSYTATAAGTDYWVASYNGDIANLTAITGCGDEPVTINPANVTLSPGTLTATDPSTGKNSYSYDFGDVLPDMAQETFTVTNNSANPVDALFVEPSGGSGFGILSSSCFTQPLAAGDSCTFDVEFTGGAGCASGLTSTFDLVGKTSGFIYLALTVRATCG